MQSLEQFHLKLSFISFVMILCIFLVNNFSHPTYYLKDPTPIKQPLQFTNLQKQYKRENGNSSCNNGSEKANCIDLIKNKHDKKSKNIVLNVEEKHDVDENKMEHGIKLITKNLGK